MAMLVYRSVVPFLEPNSRSYSLTTMANRNWVPEMLLEKVKVLMVCDFSLLQVDHNQAF